MRHIQSFNESIVDDKIEYLRDLCQYFFDDFDQFDFRIIKGMTKHLWSSLIHRDDFGGRHLISGGKNSENYIFLYVANNMDSDLNPVKLSEKDNSILDDFENYLIRMKFPYRSVTGGYYYRIYKFDKRSK
jgi:hypothetical protein